MEYVMCILTTIGTVATIISTVIAVKAKNEAKSILDESRNVSNSGKTTVSNSGSNSGTMAGQNSGEVHNVK